MGGTFYDATKELFAAPQTLRMDTLRGRFDAYWEEAAEPQDLVAEWYAPAYTAPVVVRRAGVCRCSGDPANIRAKNHLKRSEPPEELPKTCTRQ